METVWGRKPVLEYLQAQPHAQKIYVQKGVHLPEALQKVLASCDAPIQRLSKVEMDRKFKGNHQGVVVLLDEYRYARWSKILDQAGEQAFFVLLDGITDPHNLGAILRSAECAGVDAVLIPSRRSAGVNGTVHKVSCGASLRLPVVQIGNISQAIERMQRHGIHVYGLAGEADQSLFNTNFPRSVCLVIGSEGKGMAMKTRSYCDTLLSIPMRGEMESLNASVSAALAMYEVFRQRIAQKE